MKKKIALFIILSIAILSAVSFFISSDKEKTALETKASPQQSSEIIPIETNETPLKEDEIKGQEDIPIQATSAIIVDNENNEMVYAKNYLDKKSIASLTKLLTAHIFLQTDPDLSQMGTINQDEYTIGSTLQVDYNEELTLHELLAASIVGSANNATNALVRYTDMSEEEFVKKMNEQIEEWGIKNTEIYEVTGLDHRNKSTAKDYVAITQKVLESTTISDLAKLPSFSFIYAHSGRDKTIKNPNDLLRTRPDLNLIASKTGFLNEARYCLAFQFTKNNREYTGIILDSPYELSQYEDVIALIENI